MKPKPPGRFITLEGGEGVGKSTLAHALGAWLAVNGRNVVLTREPGGSIGADAVRNLIVRGDGPPWSPLSEALLIAAARNDHLDTRIRPALAQGEWVLCDRFTDSTYAYQVVAGGLPVETFDALNALINAPKPDLTLILDLDPAAGVARSRGALRGEDRFEHKGEAFHLAVRQAFLGQAKREPERCVVIDASQPKEETLAAAIKAVEERLG